MNRILFYFFLCGFSFVIFSCVSNRRMLETLIVIPPPAHIQEMRAAEGGVADEIRAAVELGTPSSLQRAIDLIFERSIDRGEFGRMMNAVAVTLMQRLYPNIRVSLPASDPLITHPYARILRDISQGVFTPPPANSQDYLEYVLPFLALLNETHEERLISALPILKRAEELNPLSVLAPYFIGIVYERTGQLLLAENAYRQAYMLSPDAYPAAIALARVMAVTGQRNEAIYMLQDLVLRFPDNMVIKRYLAVAYYHNRNWSHAEPALREVLQNNSLDYEILLMQAHALIEMGFFLRAIAPLDVFSANDPNNKQYLFLRARIQAEGYNNRDAAITYIRSILRSSYIDDEIAVYSADLLMASSREEDREAGRVLLDRLLDVEEPSILAIDLAFRDAVNHSDWQSARLYLNRLLRERPLSQYFLSAYKVERGLGNFQSALSYAREFNQREPSNEEGHIAYITALIGVGQREAAATLIESRLANVRGGTARAQYFYLRSIIRNDEEEALSDLRSSIFEDPRNLDSLIALFNIYRVRGDERRAIYYYRQAVSLDPDNAYLRNFSPLYENR